MPRKAKELSARAVKALKTPGAHAVGGADGLYLAVSASGSRSWLFRYSVKVGDTVRRREMGLGGFRDDTGSGADREPTEALSNVRAASLRLTLSEARNKARAAQTDLNAGRDPIDARSSAKRAPTFWKVAEEVLAEVEVRGKNAKHRQQWRNTLKDYAAPLHAKPVDTITTDDVKSVLSPIWQTKPETASRLRGRIEKVLRVAKVKGLRSGENPAAWKDNLEELLPKRRKLSRGHHAALDFRSVAKFIGALRTRDGVAVVALEFTILTAARTGEVIGARWPEFDLTAGIWTVPAARMKMEHEHRVPLSGRAVAILEAMSKLRRDDSDIVFPGQSDGGGLSNMAMATVLERMQHEGITVHGFRSSFRDWAGEVSDFPNEVCEMALAHRIRDKSEASYRRGDLFEKRRALMEAWASYCEPPAGEPGTATAKMDADTLTKRGRGRPPLTDEEILARLAEGKPVSRAAMARARASGILLPAKQPGRKRAGASAVISVEGLTEAGRLAHAMATAGDVEAGRTTDNAIAVAAIFDVEHGEAGRKAIYAIEGELLAGDFASAVTLENREPLPDQTLAETQRGPDPADVEDEQSYSWISEALRTKEGRKLIAETGLELALSKDAARGVGSEVDSIARSVKRHREKQRKADAQLDLLSWSATPRTSS